MNLHGRKQGNGGTHEAGEATNSYELFEAARVKSSAAFFSVQDARPSLFAADVATGSASYYRLSEESESFR